MQKKKDPKLPKPVSTEEQIVELKKKEVFFKIVKIMKIV